MLYLKWKQTHFKNDYGKVQAKGWDKELKYFLINIVADGYFNFCFDIRRLFDKSSWEYNKQEEESFLRAVSRTFEYLIQEKTKNNEQAPQAPIHTGVDYENYVESLLQTSGFNVSRTPTTGDQGVDLVAEKNGTRIAIQCKYYSKPVGNKAVQEVIAGRDFYNCQFACVVSNNSFTPAARKIANFSNVLLLNDNQIAAKLNEVSA